MNIVMYIALSFATLSFLGISSMFYFRWKNIRQGKMYTITRQGESDLLNHRKIVKSFLFAARDIFLKLWTSTKMFFVRHIIWVSKRMFRTIARKDPLKIKKMKNLVEGKEDYSGFQKSDSPYWKHISEHKNKIREKNGSSMS